MRVPRRKDRDFVTFNDGVLDICKVKDRKITGTKLSNVRFGYHTVGSKRFYEAKIVSDKIDEMVKILPSGDVSTLDMCIIRDIQYKILQIQNKYDASPPHLLLSLERIVTQYKDVRESGEN
jgi:hypothetical protein